MVLIAVDLGLLESINCVKGWMGGHNDLSALFLGGQWIKKLSIQMIIYAVQRKDL